MAELGWGAGGIQAAIESRGELQQQSQSAQLFPGALQEQDLTIQQKTIANASAQVGLQQQLTELAMLSKAAAGGKLAGMTPQDQLMTLAGIDMSAGDLAAAGENISRADTVLKNQADIAAKSTDLNNKLWGDVSNELNGVNSAQSWQQSLLVIQLSHPEIAQSSGFQAIMKAGYSQDLVDRLKGIAQTQLQAAQQKKAEADTAKAAADAKLDPLRADLVKAQTAAARALADRRKAAGAGNLNPKPADIKVITDLMKGDYDDLSDPDAAADFDDRAGGAAERMLELQRQNIPRIQAARQAYAEAKAAGDFGGLSLRTVMKPSSKDDPRPAPADGKFQDNQWYRSPNGQVGLYHAATNSFTIQ